VASILLEKFYKLELNAKIALYFLVFGFIGVCLTSYLAISFLTDQMLKKEFDHQRDDARFISAFIDKIISNRFESMRDVASGFKSLDDILTGSRGGFGRHDGLFFLSSDGSIIRGNPDDAMLIGKLTSNFSKFDSQKNSNHGAIRSELMGGRFLTIDKDRMVAVFSIPLRGDDGVVFAFLVQERSLGSGGEFDVSVVLGKVSPLVSSYDIISRTDSVYISITNDQQSLKSIKQRGLYELLDKRLDDNTESLVGYDEDGNRVVSSAVNLKNADWCIATYSGAEGIYNEIRSYALFLVSIFLFVFISMGVLVFNLTKREMAPIAMMSKEIYRYATGSGGWGKYAHSGNIEVDRLVDSLNLLHETIVKKTLDDEAKTKRLERSLEEKAVALNEKSIAEKNELIKSNFISNVSHEIRTPLNSISAISRILNEMTHSEYTSSLVKKLDKSCKAMIVVVNEVLELQKIGDDSFSLNPSVFNLVELVDDVFSIVSTPAKEKRLNLIFASPPNCNLYGDSFRIKQVLINLLSNAISYTDSGSVSFGVSLDDSKDRGFHKNINRIVRIGFSVTDTGRGVKSEMLDKIFMPFEQDLDLMEDRRAGTGLGLSICQKILKKMSSSVDVVSKVGEGSIFSFDLNLPIFDDSYFESSSQIELNFRRDRLAGVSILYADDSREGLDLLKSILESEGASVVCVENGADALDCVEKGDIIFDVILMDIFMPVMGGIESAGKIREVRKIPIFAFTASIEVFNKIHHDNDDFFMAIGKPIDFDFLIESILKSLLHHSAPSSARGFRIFDSEVQSDLVFDLDKALSDWRDLSLLNRSLVSFFDSYKSLPSLMQSGSVLEFEDVIHKVSGTSGLLCLGVLCSASSALRESMSNGLTDGLEEFYLAHRMTFEAIGQHLGLDASYLENA
jgi:signal transduction histidine kinase/CheY-like chemotaxis protein